MAQKKKKLKKCEREENDGLMASGKVNYLMMILTNAPRRDYHLVFRNPLDGKRTHERKKRETDELSSRPN